MLVLYECEWVGHVDRVHVVQGCRYGAGFEWYDFCGVSGAAAALLLSGCFGAAAAAAI